MDWIELIARGYRLFESGIWFIGGLVFLLIGLMLVWESISYRRRAFHTTANILGVIANTKDKKIKPHYYPIYEFTTPDGELIRTKARNAGSLAKYQPKTQQSIFVDPEDVNEVRGSIPIAMIIGVCMLLSSIVLFKISSVTGRSLLWSGIIAFCLIAFWIFKNILSDVMRKPADQKERKEKRENKPKFTIRHSKRPTEKFQLSDILSADEHRQALLKQDKTTLKWMPLVLLIAVALITFGGYKGYHRGRLSLNGERTTGNVLRIETSTTSDDISYYTIVKFIDHKNQSIELRDEFGSDSPIDELGEELSVVYDPQNSKDALIDRGVWSWLMPVGFTTIGLLICWMYTNFLRSYFQRKNHAKEISN